MAITQTSDFINEYKIGKNCFNEQELEAYIVTYEKFYLLRMLGAELYDLFIADLTATTPQVPQTQRFIDIFDPFEIDDHGCIDISEGIKIMLIQFIYFHYLRDGHKFSTTIGIVQPDPSIASQTPIFNLIEMFNKGVINYCEIQDFILDNSDDYPEENGQPLQKASWA